MGFIFIIVFIIVVDSPAIPVLPEPAARFQSQVWCSSRAGVWDLIHLTSLLMVNKITSVLGWRRQLWEMLKV